MTKLADWLRKTVVKLVDPEREERVKRVSNALFRAITQHGSKMVLSETLKNTECTETDIEISKDRVLQRILEKIWEDGAVTEKENKTVEKLAVALEIPAGVLKERTLEFAKSHFAESLADAIDDGVIDSAEESRLNQIAGTVSLSLPEFVRAFFQSEAEQFVRSVFMTVISDGSILPDEWASLLTVTSRLGLNHEQLLRSVEPQAKSFVEHVLADAKSDGRLTQEEEGSLNWLLKSLVLDRDFVRYVLSVMQELKLITDISDGKLPSLSAPTGLQINAGEIVHFHSNAIWWETRVRTSGQVALKHQGTLTMTDTRLLFTGSTKSKDFTYRRIISHSGNSQYITIQVSGKPFSTFELLPQTTFAYPIFEAAVAMAFQTRVAKLDGASTRHIPREVRQRVWQRCGGRCMECGAQDYLEFDHVIPVAKGGSNSDVNVQLLCRRCNLKKSDFI